MISYSKDELIPMGELAKHLNKFLNRLKKHGQDKIAVIRNNRPEAILMPIEEYERLQESDQLLEHIDIYRIIKQRESAPMDAYLSHETMLRQFEDK